MFISAPKVGVSGVSKNAVPSAPKVGVSCVQKNANPKNANPKNANPKNANPKNANPKNANHSNKEEDNEIKQGFWRDYQLFLNNWEDEECDASYCN